MGYPKEIYDKAAAVLSSRRQYAKEQTLVRRKQIYSLLPQIEQLDRQLSQIGLKTVQAVAGAPDELDTIIERLKTQSLGLQKQRDDLLEAAGLLEIYRDDNHTCKLCQECCSVVRWMRHKSICLSFRKDKVSASCLSIRGMRRWMLY